MTVELWQGWAVWAKLDLAIKFSVTGKFCLESVGGGVGVLEFSEMGGGGGCFWNGGGGLNPSTNYDFGVKS